MLEFYLRFRFWHVVLHRRAKLYPDLEFYQKCVREVVKLRYG